MKLKTRFDRIVASVDYVAEIRVEKACFYPLPTCSSDDLPYSKGRVLLVGDAANLMDPMMGEGIYYAIRSGQIAPEAIVKAIKEDEKGISGYQEALKCSLFPDLTVALKLAKAIY
jgi:flavin-dependent dehydrogenase